MDKTVGLLSVSSFAWVATHPSEVHAERKACHVTLPSLGNRGRRPADGLFRVVVGEAVGALEGRARGGFSGVVVDDDRRN